MEHPRLEPAAPARLLLIALARVVAKQQPVVAAAGLIALTPFGSCSLLAGLLSGVPYSLRRLALRKE